MTRVAEGSSARGLSGPLAGRALFVWAVAVVTAPATAQSSAPFLSEMEPTGSYVLEVDGGVDPKALFYEGNPPVQVVMRSGNGTGFVLDRPTQSVRRLISELVRETPSGSVSLLPGAAGELVAGGYQTDGPGVRFSDGGHSYYVTLKPPLVGEVTVDIVLKHSPEYRRTMDQYTPSVEAVKLLKQCSPSAHIELFYGSWCPFCRRHVPLLLKALEDAGNPISIRIVAVPRQFSNDKEASDRGVTRVPTLITYDGSREIGRLQGQDWNRPEEALVRILPIAPPAAASNSR